MHSLLVGFGGFAGAVARFWLSTAMQRWMGPAFPWGTLSVNVLGSLVIGILMALFLERGIIGERGQLLFVTGFLGGFTTMSSFSFETMWLAAEGSLGTAMVYAVTTFASCLAATWLGWRVGMTLG